MLPRCAALSSHFEERNVSDFFGSVMRRDHMDGPHAWIQYKGSKICADIHCECGALGHVDADFCYWIKCEACGRHYGMGQNVRLHTLSGEEVASAHETAPALTIARVTHG